MLFMFCYVCICCTLFGGLMAALRSSATGWVSIQVQGEVPNIAGITLPEEVRNVATVQHTDDVRADAIAYMLRVISRYTYTHDHSIHIYICIPYKLYLYDNDWSRSWKLCTGLGLISALSLLIRSCAYLGIMCRCMPIHMYMHIHLSVVYFCARGVASSGKRSLSTDLCLCIQKTRSGQSLRSTAQDSNWIPPGKA